MYADDAAIFLKPTEKDARNLKSLLQQLGEATRLSTNFQKMIVTPICCININIDDILHQLPAKWASFPIKYLGLPLSVKSLKRIDFQPLINKAATKMYAWNVENMTQAERVCLTKTILTSQPIYLLTVFKPNKEVIDDLDRIRKRFLWAD